jgi:hypothetical protein
MSAAQLVSAITPEKIFQVATGFMASKVLLSAVELGLFTELAGQPLTEMELRARLGLHPRSARDFLDTLVSIGVLGRTDGRYSNTPETAQFLVRNRPGYLGGMFEMANSRLYGFWGSLTEALRTGKQQNEAKYDSGTFEAIYGDPARLRLFLSAMTALSAGAARAIAAKFPFSDYRSFADIGTAQGGCAVQIALAHPHLDGLGYDLPQVRPVFKEYVAANAVQDRLRFYPGDFMKEPLAKADVLIMGHILHDWNLEEKRMLVRKAYDALPAGGALIAYDCVIDSERRTNTFGLLMSLNMLIETEGGFDYTGEDCTGWMREAGFRQTRVEHLAGPESMVVGIK